MRTIASLDLGHLTLRNRVVFGPHVTNTCHDRTFTDASVAYYRRRAVGGCGLIITETASVHDSDWPYELAPAASVCADGWGRIADAAHAGGAAVFASLGHAGMQGSSAYNQAAMLAPSAVPNVATREVPKVIELHEIEAVVGGFGRAARLAEARGCDGVEIDAGQHSLVRQFLSGLTNQRTDAYGEDRLLLLREILAAVRAEVSTALVALRLCADELAPWAGITPEIAADVLDEIADQVDLVTVVRGSIFTEWATRPDGHVAPGFNIDLAAALKQRVGRRTAVAVQGSIVDVAMAEDALATGCELVEMTRAQIADPDLTLKLMLGEPRQIRPCTLCNQRCQVRDPRNPVVSCTVEPSSGFEGRDPDWGAPAATPTDVLVVGAGPTGLEAARVAAVRGHRVRVVDRASEAGGAARLVAGLPGHERVARFIDWQVGECHRLGVRIDLGVEVDDPGPGDHEETILATGGRSNEPGFSVAPDARVVTARDLLGELVAQRSPAPRPATIVVWDPIGAGTGVGLATALAAEHRVVFVTPDAHPGVQLSRTGDLAPAQQRLHGADVTIERRQVLRHVGTDHVVLHAPLTGVQQRLEADLVVDASHEAPELALWEATGRRFPRWGDAAAPRTIHEAVLEGRRAALAISVTTLTPSVEAVAG